ncbi:uncharacterized protein LOC124667061 [Lolium rigidum]|uniref:uncharacterized protein LOC124667061 n=1 Tax=Lolium rigidum TaxID=89674 RepID=UPI001F5D3855|nr:uncharacterized protein LOC124667061 [Lolium rigidum]XP_047060348.1 uncharacterized protein LOC124667061 [Lolium rigidum]
MDQLLHHQDSTFYGKEMQGCRWSFLQFFGLRRRPRSMKMLSDKKHRQDKNIGGSRLRGCYAPLKDDDSGVTEDHENTQVKHKQKGSKKNSGKAGLKSFISRKLYGKEGQKQKMLPVAPRLLRTLSIHYLESNVYVFDGESAANGNGPSHGAKSSLQNATGTNLHENTLDGASSDMSFSQLKSIGEEHMKRKSHRSISMDGILHKVPYGQKMSGETIIEELPRSASATYDRDCLKPYTATASRRHGNQSFRRSRSLSESLESYSHLLDSISSGESKRLTSSRSTRNHSLESKGLARLAEYLVIPEDALALHASEKIVVDGDVKSAVDESSCSEVAGGSENTKVPEVLSSEEKRGVEASTEADLCIAPLPSEVVDVSEEHAAATCDDDQLLSSTEANMCNDPSASGDDITEQQAISCGDEDGIHSSTEADSCTLLGLLRSEESDIAEQHTTVYDDQIKSCTAQPSEDTSVAEEHPMISNDNHIQSFEGTCCVPDPNQDSQDELNLGCEQETESPTSVLDVAFSDHTMMDDSSSLEEDILDSNEADDSVGNDDLNVQENNFSDLNDLQLQVTDPKDEAVLNYVKDIFIRSSFATEPLFDAWRSHNMAALQKEDCQHSDLSFSATAALDLAMADMSADEFLLFDLTNEALLDMYRKYDAANRGSNCARPKPVGERAMKELWGKVSYQLDEELDVDVDGILSSDLVRADRWVEFRRDGDEVGDKVADFVLDRLITELALQLAKF